MLGVIGIVISLSLLMYLSYRGLSVIILAPILALVAVLFQPDNIYLLATYTEVFMSGMASFVKAYMAMFLLGAVFGKLMDASGAAQSISLYLTSKLGAKNAILATTISCAVLTYGGVSLFVVVFAIYPIAASLFKEAGIPKRLVPATLALGSFTFTMTALPGTPQIQNAIPMAYFGTNTFAAPMLGIIGAAVMLGLGLLWIKYRANKAAANGEGYGEHVDQSSDVSGNSAAVDTPLPSIVLSFVPIIMVVLVNFIMAYFILPNIDMSYVTDFGISDAGKVIGSWSLIVALTVTIIFSMLIFRRYLPNITEVINEGGDSALLPIINTASAVGFGTVIKSLAAFGLISTAMTSIPGTPFISLATATTVLAGVTGSASGGMSIALSALGEYYMSQAVALNINPEAFHRIVAIACGGLDTLPHNGAVVTLLGVCALSHKESYGDIAVVSLVIPLIATVVTVIAASFGVV